MIDEGEHVAAARRRQRIAACADLFGTTAKQPRRAKVCSRDPHAGQGSCSYWWESCPNTVANCFARRARAADQAGEAARQAFLREEGLEA